MSFGFSISDFFTIIELVDRVRKQFAQAPSQFKAISVEVRSLSIVLRDVDVALTENDFSEEQKNNIFNIARGCRDVLNDIEKALNKYSELDSKHSSINKTVKRVWKRFTWEPDDIRDLRGRITSNITLLNLINQQATSSNIVKLIRKQDHHENQAILNWLTPFDYASQQADFISRRQPHTGKWFLNSREYQTWVETKNQILFCPGILGAGKTILTSIVIDYLITKFWNDPGVCVGYIYCNFRRQSEQKISDLLSSLLKQLCQRQLANGQSSLPDVVKDLYYRHIPGNKPHSVDEILKAIRKVVCLYSRVFIIVDALDECQVSDGCRTKLLSVMFSIQEEYNANILVTSRFNPAIEARFTGYTSIKIRAGEEDVRGFLEGHMELLPLRNPEIEKEILTTIPEAVDGMFLLAQIYFDALKMKTTPKAIRNALKDFKRQTQHSGEEQKLQVLTRAYEKAMERIKGQGKEFKDLAFQVLTWITFAVRPLTIMELRYALAIEVDEDEFDEDNLTQVELMASVCAGLVTVDKKSDTIRLVHYTTQEYFEQTRDQWFPEAHLNITRSCLSYLSCRNFIGGCCDDDEFRKELKSTPFYSYAAQHWGHHAQLVPGSQKRDILPTVVSFLQKPYHIESSSQVLPELSLQPWEVAGVHLAAYFGLEEAFDYLMDTYDLNFKDWKGRTLLILAVGFKQENIVQLALERGANIEHKDCYGFTALHHAVIRNHEGIIKLLLEKGADIEARNHAGVTPIQLSVGANDLTRLLLENAILAKRILAGTL
ncbi:hypothetical protein F5Y02DRAFT_427579 [Annulohypoxylon stygium]|nr:hypothetical protein F5Y02DRAFT_427579 [Annulohypoxylon stygium]